MMKGEDHDLDPPLLLFKQVHRPETTMRISMRVIGSCSKMGMLQGYETLNSAF